MQFFLENEFFKWDILRCYNTETNNIYRFTRNTYKFVTISILENFAEG